MRIDTRNLKRLIRTASITALAAAGLVAAMPNAADAGPRLRVRVCAPRVVFEKPKPRVTVVVRPAKPAQGKYAWVPGHYVKKPGCRRVWVAGHWKRIG